MKKILRIFIIIIIMFFIVGCKKNNDNAKSAYKIILNTKEVNLSVPLSEFTSNNSFKYVGDIFFKDIKMDGNYAFGLNNDSMNFYGIPDAGLKSFGTILDFNLKFVNNSRNYDDVNVKGIYVLNVSNNFFSINGIGCGNTLDEAINSLNIDKNSENYIASSSNDYVEYTDLINHIQFGITINDGKILAINILDLN